MALVSSTVVWSVVARRERAAPLGNCARRAHSMVKLVEAPKGLSFWVAEAWEEAMNTFYEHHRDSTNGKRIPGLKLDHPPGKRHHLDHLYQRIADDLDTLMQAVGLNVAA
jgi:hypothetical protein